MKRFLACLLAAVMVLALIPAKSFADKEDTKGELLIVADPETVYGAVDDLVKVNFYLYPNLPDDRLLDTIEGRILYDPDKLTFGAINTKDDELNLKSFLEVGSTMPITYSPEPGEIRFVYIDAYGWKTEGFWIQIVFRINKEGASAIVFNGVRYTGLDKSTLSSVSFYLDPVQVGGVATEGETVPTDAVEDITFAPMTAVIAATPEAKTPTPKPEHQDKTIPVTTALPTPSDLPQTTTGIKETATPKAPKTEGPTETEAPASEKPETTEAPIETEAPEETEQPTAAAESEQPQETKQATDTPKSTAKTEDTPSSTKAPQETEQPVVTETEKPDQPTDGPIDPAAELETDEPIDSAEPNAEETPDTGKATTVEEQTLAPETEEPQPEGTQSGMALTIAVIAGIVVVILLAVLAIVLILIRKKKMDAADGDE